MPGSVLGINVFVVCYMAGPRSSGVEQPTGDPEAGIVHKTADERRPTRQERIPLGILYMLIATVMFAGTSALAKWLWPPTRSARCCSCVQRRRSSAQAL